MKDTHKLQSQGWRDGYVVKSTCCSSIGPGLDFKQAHGGCGGSQLSVTPVPGIQSSSLATRHANGVQTYIQPKHSYI